MPPSLPSRTAKLLLRALTNATSGNAKVNHVGERGGRRRSFQINTQRRGYVDALLASSHFLEVAAVVAVRPLTMACWFRSTDITVNQCLMSISDSDRNDVRSLRLYAADAVGGDPVHAQELGLSNTGNADSTAGYSANTGAHACGMFASNTDRRAFLNGGNKGTNTTNTGGILNTQTVTSIAVRATLFPVIICLAGLRRRRSETWRSQR